MSSSCIGVFRRWCCQEADGGNKNENSTWGEGVCASVSISDAVPCGDIRCGGRHCLARFLQEVIWQANVMLLYGCVNKQDKCCSAVVIVINIKRCGIKEIFP